MIDVDAARLQLFINTYMVSDVNEQFNRKNVKNFDASNLPMCKSELLLQFRRGNYITSLLSNAHMKGLSIFSPENNGWTLEDNQYRISTGLIGTSYRPLLVNHFKMNQWYWARTCDKASHSPIPIPLGYRGHIYFTEDTKDADEDNEDNQYQHWIGDKILNFNDNED
ncbi:uncharacterized protein TNCV_5114791 [Trichonephila clavipes]|nr:uncharacterized protein TNCV_5114791 [Trichonephila clavipes]